MNDHKVAAKPALAIQTDRLALARYCGTCDFPGFGVRHQFILLSNWTVPHRLAAGAIVSDAVVRELGGQFELDNLAEGALIYLATQP